MPTRKPARHKDTEATKLKIGTILDRTVVQKLKQRALQEDKPISTIIEEAILRYESAETLEYALRVRALESVLALRFNISSDDLRSIMEEDYYNQ